MTKESEELENEEEDGDVIWDDMLKEFDADNDGFVTKDEFFASMRKLATKDMTKAFTDG